MALKCHHHIKILQQSEVVDLARSVGQSGILLNLPVTHLGWAFTKDFCCHLSICDRLLQLQSPKESPDSWIGATNQLGESAVEAFCIVVSPLHMCLGSPESFPGSLKVEL